MRYLLSGLFAIVATIMWRYVWCAVASGIVLKPRGKAWWRDDRYYERESEPIRFWISIGAHAVVALLGMIVTIATLIREPTE